LDWVFRIDLDSVLKTIKSWLFFYSDKRTELSSCLITEDLQNDALNFFKASPSLHLSFCFEKPYCIGDFNMLEQSDWNFSFSYWWTYNIKRKAQTLLWLPKGRLVKLLVHQESFDFLFDNFTIWNSWGTFFDWTHLKWSFVSRVNEIKLKSHFSG